MDVEAAPMLARGLKAHKRKGAAASRSAKKAKVEETSSIVPVQVAPAIDVPSDAEPSAPRASSRSPPTGAPVSRVCSTEAPVVERGRRRKSVARRVSSHQAAIEESLGSEGEPGENPSNDRDLIK